MARLSARQSPTDSESDLAELMVGRAVQLVRGQEARPRPPAEPRAGAERGIWVASPNGALAVRDLDLTVSGGEIVCIAGVKATARLSSPRRCSA